jgi:hypothetical protein
LAVESRDWHSLDANVKWEISASFAAADHGISYLEVYCGEGGIGLLCGDKNSLETVTDSFVTDEPSSGYRRSADNSSERFSVVRSGKRSNDHHDVRRYITLA